MAKITTAQQVRFSLAIAANPPHGERSTFSVSFLPRKPKQTLPQLKAMTDATWAEDIITFKANPKRVKAWEDQWAKLNASLVKYTDKGPIAVGSHPLEPIPLGYDRGRYYLVSRLTERVYDFYAGDFGENVLRDLSSYDEYWLKQPMFYHDGEFDISMAMEWIYGACKRLGIYEPSREMQQAVAARAKNDPAPARPLQQAAPYDWPFRLTSIGVEKRVEYKDKTTQETVVEWHWLCSHLEVAADTRTDTGEDWGRLLGVTDRDGKLHDWAMPMSMLAGDGTAYRERLLSLGLVLSSARHAREWLAEYIQTARPESKARAVNRLGWAGRAFVMPDATLGDTSGERLLLQTSGAGAHAFRVAGTLADWQQHVAAPCAGNSRLVLAMSAAFAAPLLHLTGAESGGYHFRGKSSGGKTTALVVAGSVWGGGGLKGYIKSWRTTDNGLEGVAAGHCDALLCLDELSQVDAKAAGAVAYMLANGSGKSRAGRGGESREAAEWRLLFLSNGEISLADKMAEDGKGRRVAAGQAVRVIDLPADAGAGMGLFESLHGAPTGDAFSRQLKDACGQFYGTAARAFLEAITSEIEQTAEAVSAFSANFVARYVPAGADGQVSRAAARFALVAAAGELAIRVGVVPWQPGEARIAASRCFQDWLAGRGGTGAAETTAGIAAVRRFIELHGESRFTRWGDGQQDHDDNPLRATINRAGFRRAAADGGTEYFILPEVWKTEVCAGHDAFTVAKALEAAGMLKVGSDGKLQTNNRLPGTAKPVRCYHVLPSIQGGDDAGN